MTAPSRPAIASTDPRVQAAWCEYMEAVDRGETIEVERFLAGHPDAADELRSLIAFDEEARRLVGGGSPKPGSPPALPATLFPNRPKADVSTQSVVAQVVETSTGKRKPTSGEQPAGKSLSGPNDAGLSVPSAPAFASLVKHKVAAPPPVPTPITRSAADLPESFGRYRVRQKLGFGAMGAVYLAEDTLLQRDVALKTPTFEDDADGELLKRFYREARAVSKLKHQNLCGVYDVGEIDGRHYISMEFVPGKKLQEFIKPDKPMTEKQAMAVVRKIALAMHEAHTHGVIHRDLKPDNIMVNEKGEPVVMDFGLVHKTDQQNSTKITQRGTLIGSPAYMSKEQVEGDPDKLTGATDQYSLGVVLYQLLTSKLPFEGGIHAVLGAILVKEPPRPSEHRPDLNPHLEAVCLKMMAKEANARYPSMKAAADALAEVAKGTSKAAGSVVAPAPIARSLTDGITATFAGVAVPREQATLPDPNTAPPNSSPFRRFIAKQPMSVQYGSLAAGLVLLWAVVLWFRSGDALVKVTIDSDDVEVTFQDQTIKVKDGTHEYKIKPGDHTLRIKSGNIEFDTEKFTLNKGVNPAVTVELVESEIIAKLGTRKLTVSFSGEFSTTGKLIKAASFDVITLDSNWKGTIVANHHDGRLTVVPATAIITERGGDGFTIRITAINDRGAFIWEYVCIKHDQDYRIAKASLERSNWTEANGEKPIDTSAITIRDNLLTIKLSRPVAGGVTQQTFTLERESSDFNAWAWGIVAQSNREPSEYAAALDAASQAVRLNPDDSSFLNTLGVAQYRVGEFQNAIETMSKSETLNGSEGLEDWEPSSLCFTAMAKFRLGDSAGAKTLIEQVQTLNVTTNENAGFLDEAETLIDPERAASEATAMDDAETKKLAGIAALKQAVLNHTWHYRDSLFPPGGETFRFNDNGTFHYWRWNYWVVGPREIRVHYDRNNKNSATGIAFKFNEDLTKFSSNWKDSKGKTHVITGWR